MNIRFGLRVLGILCVFGIFCTFGHYLHPNQIPNREEPLFRFVARNATIFNGNNLFYYSFCICVFAKILFYIQKQILANNTELYQRSYSHLFLYLANQILAKNALYFRE